MRPDAEEILEDTHEDKSGLMHCRRPFGQSLTVAEGIAKHEHKIRQELFWCRVPIPAISKLLSSR